MNEKLLDQINTNLYDIQTGLKTTRIIDDDYSFNLNQSELKLTAQDASDLQKTLNEYKSVKNLVKELVKQKERREQLIKFKNNFQNQFILLAQTVDKNEWPEILSKIKDPQEAQLVANLLREYSEKATTAKTKTWNWGKEPISWYVKYLWNWGKGKEPISWYVKYLWNWSEEPISWYVKYLWFIFVYASISLILALTFTKMFNFIIKS